MIIKLFWNTAVPLLLQVFKGHNGTWPKTEVVITDKDMAERRVFSAAFPTASLQLCLFHTLRTISREVTISRDALLTIFSAMAHARSETVFNEQCTLLTQMDVPAASTYFERNWLPIKREWVTCFKVKSFNLGESTNNRLESFNGKLKSVCSRLPPCTHSSRIYTLCCVCCAARGSTSASSAASASCRGASRNRGRRALQVADDAVRLPPDRRSDGEEKRRAAGQERRCAGDVQRGPAVRYRVDLRLWVSRSQPSHDGGAVVVRRLVGR